MRLLPLLALPLIATAVMAADTTDRGPGLPGQRQGDTIAYGARDFTGVEFGIGGGTADVRVGPDWSVRAVGPAAVFDKLRVIVEQGRLRVNLRDWKYGDEYRAQLAQVHFTITAPRLSQVGLGGSGHMNVDKVEGGDFRAAMGGSGTVVLDRVAVQSLTVSIGGTGKISAAGTADRLSVNMGGSGRFDAPALRARSANISTAGSGVVRTVVDGDANISAVGSGEIDLGNGARCRKMVQGGTTIRCGS